MFEEARHASRTGGKTIGLSPHPYEGTQEQYVIRASLSTTVFCVLLLFFVVMMLASLSRQSTLPVLLLKKTT